MKFSELVRCGAALHPQAFWALGVHMKLDGTTTNHIAEGAQPDADGYITATCVIGAAYECATKRMPPLAGHVTETNLDDVVTAINTLVGYDITDKRVDTSEIRNIGMYGSHAPVYSTATYLNDSLRWSREKIADWFEERGL